MTEILSNAILLMIEAHENQMYGPQPYFWHPLRVGFAMFPDQEKMIIGFFHDILEDTGKTYLTQISSFGLAVLSGVKTLTRDKNIETYFEYCERIANRPFVKRVKIADITDNLKHIQIHGFHYETLMPRYKKALEIIEGSK